MVLETLNRLYILKQDCDYKTKDNTKIKPEKKPDDMANIDKLLYACRDDNLQLVIDLNYLITDATPLELTVIHESVMVFNYLLANFPFYNDDITWFANRTENKYISDSLKKANKAP